MGETQEEIAAASPKPPAGVCALRVSADKQCRETCGGATEDLAAGVNAGAARAPVYNPGMNMAVAYGYEDRGKSLLLTRLRSGRGPGAGGSLPPRAPTTLPRRAWRGAVSRRYAGTGASGVESVTGSANRAHRARASIGIGKATFAHWIQDLQEPTRRGA